jgi:hypothetical protein
MTPLEDMSIWQRIVLALVILVVVAIIVFGLSLTLDEAPPASAAPASSASLAQLYDGVSVDQHLLRIDKDALEEAYRASIVKLWTVWLSSGAPKDATNMRTGLERARRSYAQAAEQITKRETELQQTPIPPERPR